MTEASDSTQTQSMADQLIEAERGTTPAPSIGADPEFERLLEIERTFERRVGRIAAVSWAVAFACLVVVAIAVMTVTNLGGTVVEVIRVLLIISSVTGVVALLAAIVTSISWLFRSRTATLKVIERRLAALEKLLQQQR